MNEALLRLGIWEPQKRMGKSGLKKALLQWHLLGIAVATGKLKFEKGDFASMIKNPSMAGPFVKSFALMAQI